jgi:hypothetical protein
MGARMAMFDLKKTAELERLSRVPREQRDPKWVSEFCAAAPEASLKTAKQQLIQGPDGFPYLALFIPAEGEEFTAFCISQVALNCLEHGAGCVICSTAQQPEWVFTYGNLWSLHSYNTFDATPTDAKESDRLSAGRQVLIAAPNDTFLPKFARDVIKAFLTKCGVQNPRVLLISDASATPPQSLAFSLYESDFVSPEAFNEVMNRLKAWFLPPHYGLIVLPKSPDYESHFVPL